MARVTPPTQVGGDPSFYRRLAFAMGFLGSCLGFIIFFVTVALMLIEVVLNPTYLFAQANANGVDAGLPWTSFSWWIIVFVSISTTGTQYALFQPRSEGGKATRVGRSIGWGLVAFDTFMDGGGLAALAGGDALTYSPDGASLQYGMFPEAGSNWKTWAAYVFFMLLCAFHEPGLRMLLGRLTFERNPNAGEFFVNVLIWSERAGKFFNEVRLWTIAFAPFFILGLDLALFTQVTKDGTLIEIVSFLLLSGGITAFGIMAWEYYNDLRRNGQGQYKIRHLDLRHQGVFLLAFLVTVADSGGDLVGFNKILFGQETLLPTGIVSMVPFFLTAGLVMLMCTTFEALNSDLFGPLSALVHKMPGGSASSSPYGGGPTAGPNLWDVPGAGGPGDPGNIWGPPPPGGNFP